MHRSSLHQAHAYVQVVIALSNSELIYFELNAAGQLLEVEKQDVAGDVSCLAIAPVSEGRARAPFVVVGSYDHTARVLSLEPGSALALKATQTVSAIPHSALLLEADVSAAGAALFSIACPIAQQAAQAKRSANCVTVVRGGRPATT